MTICQIKLTISLHTIEILVPFVYLHTGSLAHPVKFDHSVFPWSLFDQHFALAQSLFHSFVLVFGSEPSTLLIESSLPNLGEVETIAGNILASFSRFYRRTRCWTVWSRTGISG